MVITGEQVTKSEKVEATTARKREANRERAHTLEIPAGLWQEMQTVSEQTGIGIGRIRGIVAEEVFNPKIDVRELVKKSVFG